MSSLEKIKNFTPIFGRNGKIRPFSTVGKSLNIHGTISVHLLCRLLTVSCLKKIGFTPMPQINTGTVLKYETLATLFSAKFFPCFI